MHLLLLGAGDSIWFLFGRHAPESTKPGTSGFCALAKKRENPGENRDLSFPRGSRRTFAGLLRGPKVRRMTRWRWRAFH